VVGLESHVAFDVVRDTSEYGAIEENDQYKTNTAYKSGMKMRSQFKE
jgi:hypothetical protein